MMMNDENRYAIESCCMVGDSNNDDCCDAEDDGDGDDDCDCDFDGDRDFEVDDDFFSCDLMKLQSQIVVIF